MVKFSLPMLCRVLCNTTRTVNKAECYTPHATGNVSLHQVSKSQETFHLLILPSCPSASYGNTRKNGEITGAATMVNGWIRNSGCTGINRTNANVLGEGFNFFGCEQSGAISSSSATFSTHVYEVVEYYDGSWHSLSTPVWYPSTINDATCTYTLLLEDLTATDIEKAPEDEISVRLMPNPTNDIAFLRYVLPKNAATLRIDLHDINGKIIRNIYNGEQDKGIYSRELNVTDLASGLYFVHLYSEDFSITKKINKQ